MLSAYANVLMGTAEAAIRIMSMTHSAALNGRYNVSETLRDDTLRLSLLKLATAEGTDASIFYDKEVGVSEEVTAVRTVVITLEIVG